MLIYICSLPKVNRKGKNGDRCKSEHAFSPSAIQEKYDDAGLGEKNSRVRQLILGKKFFEKNKKKKKYRKNLYQRKITWNALKDC